MSDSAQTWWLSLPDGSRRRIAEAGILVGRGLDCDVVLAEPEASRHHALVHVTADGPRLVAMGRAPTLVGTKEVDTAMLAAGDRIRVPGLEMRVQAEAQSLDKREPTWVMRVIGGAMFGVADVPLTVGGGPSDDVRFDDLPPAAIRFYCAQQRLFAELGVKVSIGRSQRSHEPGEVVQLDSGNVLRVGDHRIQVVASGQQLHLASTVADTGTHRALMVPTRVHLQSLPRGARLHITLKGTDHSAYISDECRDLLACLLAPPEPHQPGEMIPDKLVLRKVWPLQGRSGSDLNLLLQHLRRDLIRAGLDGVELVQRAKGGGATQFGVTDRTLIEIS